MAICRAAEDAMLLERFHATFVVAPRDREIARRLLPSSLSRRLARYEYAAYPPGRVRSHAAALEGAVAVLRHSPAPRILVSRLMYANKRRFDESVARGVDPETDVLLGIYGSSATTFRSSRALRVLQFVNSHPAWHNALLLRYAGPHVPTHELIPPWVQRRVESELEDADLILVPSLFVRDQLLSEGISGDRLRVIPYGVNMGEFRPPSAGERRTETDQTVVFVGQISFRKGVPDLLRAAAQFPSVRFRLIGPMVSPKAIASAPPNVTVTPSLPHADVARVLREADLFVMPSLEDAYPLGVLEAMASGVPVIVTANVGSAEAVRPSEAGLVVPPGEPAQLAEAIGVLLADPQLRRAMGMRGREAVASAQTWETYGQTVIRVIAEAWRSRRSRP